MNFMSSVVNFFKDGGLFLYPLALIFVVGVSIAIERFVYLTRETIRNRTLWDNLVPALSAGNFKQVVALTQNSKASIATILNYGVARVATARRRDDIEKAMDESLLEVIPRIEKRTHYLSSLANVGLLIGLLGTITGLIGAFSAVATANPAEKASLLAAAHLGRHEQHRLGPGRRHHAAARAHVPRVEDDLADRQPGDRVREIPELDHRAPARRGGAAGAAGAAPQARAPAAARGRSESRSQCSSRMVQIPMKSKSAQHGPAQSRPLPPGARRSEHRADDRHDGDPGVLPDLHRGLLQDQHPAAQPARQCRARAVDLPKGLKLEIIIRPDDLVVNDRNSGPLKTDREHGERLRSGRTSRCSCAR